MVAACSLLHTSFSPSQTGLGNFIITPYRAMVYRAGHVMQIIYDKGG